MKIRLAIVDVNEDVDGRYFVKEIEVIINYS